MIGQLLKVLPRGTFERVGVRHHVGRAKRGLSPAALQFPMFHPAVAAVIPGAHNLEVLGENLANFRLPIPPGLWRDLKSEGLIRSDAPTA